jgi:hypothetical protein
MMYTSKAELLQQLEEWELKHKELLEKEEDNEVYIVYKLIIQIVLVLVPFLDRSFWRGRKFKVSRKL